MSNTTVLDANIEHGLSIYGSRIVRAYWQFRDRMTPYQAEQACWLLVETRRHIVMAWRVHRRHKVKVTNRRAPSEVFDFIAKRMLHAAP